MFQQLTGINVIMFYSNSILKNAGMPPSSATLLVGILNVLATCGGMGLLSKFGRKQLMVWGSVAMVVALLSTGAFQILGYGLPTTFGVLAFIIAFEFTSGPITWLYMSEIMDDKATGFASALNWLMNCVIGGVVPYAIRAITDGGAHGERVGYIFVVCAGLSLCGLLFVMKYMKETRGLTKAQIEYMFSDDPNKDVLEEGLEKKGEKAKGEDESESIE